MNKVSTLLSPDGLPVPLPHDAWNEMLNAIHLSLMEFDASDDWDPLYGLAITVRTTAMMVAEQKAWLEMATSKPGKPSVSQLCFASQLTTYYSVIQSLYRALYDVGICRSEHHIRPAA